MKIQLALLSSVLLLTACATPNSLKVVTKGPLICEANEVCPELAMRWNEEKRDGFKITADIKNAEQYNIQQFVFTVDGQPYAYSTIAATENTTLENGSKLSSNYIIVPVSFLNSFRNGKEISLKLMTDKGDIERPLLKADGQKSSAYLTFIKGYSQHLTQQK